MMVDFYRFSLLSKNEGCFHTVTTKQQLEPFNFSLALHTGEDTNSIIENRKKLSFMIEKDKNIHFIVANQTHSDHIKVISEKEPKGWESTEDAVADCDALITNKKGLILTILTADCVPVLLYDREKHVVAAVHAGWRGTTAKIVEKTVKKMREVYGCKPQDIIAGVAPSIGRCCYEVGEDVAEHFFEDTSSFDIKGEKYMLDLPFINKKQLLNAGLLEKHIEMSGICTACEVERFFSYRKEQGCSGRFMSMIGLQDV